MKVELTRFRVKEGKSERVDEWLKFLNENMIDVLITLGAEKMYVETIFREHLNGYEFLYWYSVQGQGGQEVEESDHWIDKKHLEYWKECIDETFRPVDLKTEVVMIPENIRQNMK
ncbi:DUF6176 family protein [Peribacillus frigoritolerans]|uniref:DUF6176 family protein n=1 Tax=Peribacillus frigoritolerans TaxID=450367 RepID=UPI002B253D5B|nr:DUF6176 family protein [Peribacillus frigoritolerans]MEB2628422.1 DUF6176 family protein [Peribacillus frigoritolerans]MEE3952931.1 DUF6176 family protein [Peribacillus frigoritolerans]QYF80210.1 hypothetical protein KY492_14670 [Brevibacterium sp. PAMC21349]